MSVELVRQILDVLFIIGFGQGIMLAGPLFKKKENTTANKLLAFTVIAFSIELLMALYINRGYYLGFPHFIGLTAGFPYLYGPCIYLYITILGHRREGFRKMYWLHFIPFGIIYFIALVFFVGLPGLYKIQLFNPDFPKPLYMSVAADLIPLHGCIYAFFTIREVRRFNRALKGNYANLDKLHLGWLTFLGIGASVIWSIVVIAYLLDYFSHSLIPTYALIYPSIAILIYMMGYKSLRQPDLQFEDNSFDSPADSAEQPEPYKKSGMSSETAQTHLNSLFKIMNENKPFLDCNIRLPDLAKMLNISPHNLSEILNTKLNESFYDFINKHRIEEVKRLISEDKQQQYNLLALGYEAGFSSKSAYYASFKKVTGLTPARYRAELKENTYV